MKRIMTALALMLTFTGAVRAAQYDYTTVNGDPLQTRIYTLGNGLKVYMSVNKEKPRIQTYIAVNTGSRNDPKETTGLAHYLEHLMFKGTTHFGTSNLEAERPLLDSIESRFEQYRYIVNPEERKAWYHQIDSISQIAALYNIPNEYDKMMSAIGSEGSNAYTSNDQTCYQEDIPSNELETWARIQSDRFQNMVIRGFHTELEAVYEEYNIGLANDGNKEWNALNKKLFPTHPYGTQTTIGTQEHLKNPSITNIKNYFHKYYVPNNIAIVLAGDFDPDKAIALIDKYFGSWKPSKGIDRPEYAPVAALTQPADTSVVGQEAENLLIGWKFNGAASLQADTLDLVASILANGKAGLFDTDLNQPMKLQAAEAMVDGMHDYSVFVLAGVPKNGQSLDEVKALILAEVEKLKKGEFDEGLIKAVVANKKRDLLQQMDNNRSRVEMMKDAFINGKNWQQEVGTIERQANMTRQQIADFAGKWLGNGYACVYKLQGNDTTIHKIDKPEITPIPTNNDKHSEFLQQVVNTEVSPIQPKFTDFSNDLEKQDINKSANLIYKQNTDNDLFTLAFDFPTGTESDNRLALAADIFDYAGTAKMDANDIQKALYSMACSFGISARARHTRFTISGLGENMTKALALFADILDNGRISSDDYSQVVQLVLKNREDAKTNQRRNFSALLNYGEYGPVNPIRNVMSKADMENAEGNKILGLLGELRAKYNMTVMYYGPADINTVSKLVKKHIKSTAKSNQDTGASRKYVRQTTPQNEILLAPYDAKNIYMVQYHNENREWTPDNAPVNALFNEYFGGGMGAIVFQELREARGLAYSAAAYYNSPDYKGDKEDFYTYIITQNDKMTDCIGEFNNLLNDMPAREASFNLAKQSLTKTIATSRTTKFAILNAYMNARDLGIDFDLNKVIYEKLPSITLQQLSDFAKSRISGKPYKYLILGDENNLDIKALEKIGPIHRISTEELFGY